MPNFLDELVFNMPAMSMAKIESLGNVLLETLSPETLARPGELNLAMLIEEVLPKYDIHVYPAGPEELGDLEAATDPEGDAEVYILLAENLWDDFYQGGKKANRARATIAHEVSHAVIHVPVVRGRLKSPHKDLLLARIKRANLRPYKDPEWQAWALAGCLLMPRRTIELLEDQSVFNIAETYGVSPDFARSHAKRLRLI
jgi:hypothetical protein